MAGEEHQAVADSDQKTTEKDTIAQAKELVGQPATGQSEQIVHRSVEAVDGAGLGDGEAETACGGVRDHVEEEDGAKAVVAESLPHLGKEERREASGMPEECGICVYGSQATYRNAVGLGYVSRSSAESRTVVQDQSFSIRMSRLPVLAERPTSSSFEAQFTAHSRGTSMVRVSSLKVAVRSATGLGCTAKWKGLGVGRVSTMVWP